MTALRHQGSRSSVLVLAQAVPVGPRAEALQAPAGQPERQGNERNYQKYLDRTQKLKDDIARTESDVNSSSCW